MLEPIDNSNLVHALDLLMRGFPHRSQAWWERAVERITRFNAYSSQSSIGQFLVVKGAKVGVMLTPKSQSHDTRGRRYDVTNLSSWYVAPDHRVLAPLMLREMVRDRETVFTDLTPSRDVVRLLPPLGFRPLNAGISAIAVPLAALQRTGTGRVSGLEEMEPGALTSDDRILLERAATFGAMAAILTVDCGHHPLLFVSRTVRQLPVAELIYCSDNLLLMRDIRAIARFLLKQGKLVLIVDIPLGLSVPGTHFIGRGLKFARGGCAANSTNRTDYVGSELLLVGR
jgi:hypothetical protein